MSVVNLAFIGAYAAQLLTATALNFDSPNVANLNFSGNYTPPNLGGVNLNFGASAPVYDPSSAVVLMVTQAPKFDAVGHYASNTSRPFTAQPRAGWQEADAGNKDADGGWQLTSLSRIAKAQPWGEAPASSLAFTERSEQLQRARVDDGVDWAQAVSANAEPLSAAHQQMLPRPMAANATWEAGIAVQRSTNDAFVQLWPSKHLKELVWGEGEQFSTVKNQRFSVALPSWFSSAIPWQLTRQPLFGFEPPTVLPPETGYLPTYNLNFECLCAALDPLRVRLNFSRLPCSDSPIVPIKKAYFIVNSLSLKRVSDNTPIEILSASVGTDNGSWCWSFSASMPHKELEKVEPGLSGPVEVELEVNGITWRLLVEQFNTKEVFAKADVSISGRSVTAYLESPYAPVRSFTQSTTLSSRQFAEAELTRAGLVTGYTLDWRLIDALGWSMPAGTWSYNDLTPIQVIQAIAQGAGGFVNSHPVNKQLIVLPEYPTPYWGWNTATIARSIPQSVIKSRNLRWSERPSYTGVYVSGESTGVTAFVKRTGTDGAYQAPMFVNPMISASAAARNKGMSILSAGGRQAQVGLDLPMEPAIGLLTPGMIIEVTNGGLGSEPAWRGLVRSTSISAAWSSGLTVSQSIDLERHYGGL